MQTQNKDKINDQREVIESLPHPTPHWPIGIVVSKKERISVSVSEELSVILTKEAFEQLFGWAYSTAREISCLGSVVRSGNRFVIEQFYLLKQSGTSASTELDESAIAELIERLIAEGKRDDVSRIKCWAHSHPNMETFWSSIDDQTCKLLVNDYLISLVVADDFEIRCRIDITGPVSVVFDNIPVLYQMPKDSLPIEKYAQEVGNAVSEKAFCITETENKADMQLDKLIPEAYCGYCGYWHSLGKCPLAEAENLQQVLDEEDSMMF